MDLEEARQALDTAEAEVAEATKRRDFCERAYRALLADEEERQKERAAMAARSPEAFAERKARVRALMAPLEQLKLNAQREGKQLQAKLATADPFHARDSENDLKTLRRLLEQIEHGVEPYGAHADQRLADAHDSLDSLAFRGRPSLVLFQRMLAAVEDEEREARRRHPSEWKAAPVEVGA